MGDSLPVAFQFCILNSELFLSLKYFFVSKRIAKNGNQIILHSCIFRWDTAGQEAYEEARRVCYDGTHVLLIGFSVVEPDSLANVENLWAKEAKLDALKNAPVGQRVLQ